MSLLRISTSFSAVFASITVSAALPAAAQASATPPSFTFTNINVPNATNTYVFGFAPDGGLVGSFYDASNNLHGFIQDKAGTVKQFDLRGVKGLIGSAIQAQNTAGTLAQAYVSTTAGQVVVSYFISKTGKYTRIAVPNAKSTYAWSMNASGIIVGSYLSADGSITEAFTYRDGKYTTFRKPGMATTTYNGINDKGDIVGGYQYEAGQYLAVGFILSAGKMKQVEYPGVTATNLQGINNAGEVVGYVRDYFDRSNTGFVYKSGAFTDVGVGASDYVWAWAIDSKGDIVGADVGSWTAVSGFLGTVH